jgi:cytochrome c biogenesis protein ResB
VTLSDPQKFACNGRTYQITLRPVRYYKPYAVTLLAFNHDIYPGTDIPKNFSSKIHLHDPSTGEDRDVLIYMNNPLRYRGETYFQASFEPGDKGTILQVVRNPASLTPYVACSLVALGLLVQFLTHLVKFARKRAVAAHPVVARGSSVAVPLQPVLASKRSAL